MQLYTVAVVFLLTGLTLIEAKSKADSAVLLSNVKTLTLYGDKKTSHRRVFPIPQLTCVGGDGCKHYKVDLMRCQNAGSEYDAEDVQWTCSASLPSEFKLGSTEVICEGYDNADDPWILKGSCGVEYRLLLTDEGERKYAKRSKPEYRSRQDKQPASNKDTKITLGTVLFFLVFFGILCLFLYRIFFPPNNAGQIRLGGNNRPGWGGGGGGGYGGGGDNGFDDPPPPYSPRPPTQPRAKPSASGGSTAGSSRSNGTQTGPGFWTGAATGGAAGYGAGYYHGSRTSEAERRRQRDRERSLERAQERQRERERDWERERERSRERQRQRATSSSLFGSAGGNGSSSNSRGSAGGGWFSSSGGNSPSPSSSRHESTGFGGTRRR